MCPSIDATATEPGRPPAHRVVAHAAAGVALTAVTLHRLAAAGAVTRPGHADAAFHYELSRNLRTGRGLVVDYVWQFSTRPPGLTHYAVDYWLPLPAVLLAALSPLTGSSPAGAVRASVVLGTLLALATAWLARQLTSAWWAPPLAAVLTLVHPLVSLWCVQIDSSVPAALFSVLALAAALGAGPSGRRWVGAGALAALALLCRSDAAFVVPSALLAGLTSRPRARWAVGRVGLGALVVLAPLLVADQVEIGRPLPAPLGWSVALRSYEDLYAWEQPTTDAWAEQSVEEVVRQRGDAAGDALSTAAARVGGTVLAASGGVVALGLAAAGGRAVRRRRVPWRQVARWAVLAGVAVVPPVAAVLVVPFVAGGGSVGRWSVVLAALLSCAATGAIEALARSGTVGRAVAVGAAGTVLVASLARLPVLTQEGIAASRSGSEVARTAEVLDAEAAALGRPPVVMTRRPWELTTATGRRSVMVPADGVAAARVVARRYHVTHVLLPGSRPFLDSVAELAALGRPTLVGAWPGGMRLYRITPP